MPQNDGEHTGQRIAHYRKLRHLTQHGLAEKANISYSLLTKVEQGRVPVSPMVQAAISRALQVQAGDLSGQPYLAELQQDELDVLIQPIRDALDLYDLGPDPEVSPRDLSDLHGAAETLCAKVRQTDLKRVATELPSLISEVTTAAHASPTEQAWKVLASTYRTAYDVTSKLGYSDLSMVALDRLDWAAQRASDPVLAAARQYFRTLAYMRASGPAIGQRLMSSGFAYLAQSPAGRERDVVTGQLHLGAAVVEARGGNADAAQTHIAEARRFAAITGSAEQVHWLSFGPTNVEVHNVSILADQGKYAAAVAAAHSIEIPAGWAASRRSAHVAEVARAQMAIGNTDQAFNNILLAREIAPQQTRYHPQVRDTVSGLVSRRRSAPRSLTNLAHWVGM